MTCRQNLKQQSDEMNQHRPFLWIQRWRWERRCINFWVCNTRGFCYAIVYGSLCERKESMERHADPGHENWALLLAWRKRP